jgi:hypothetical protein
MDFTLTSEQDELVRTLRGFAKKELAPRSSEWDRSGEFPWDAWKKMGELGLLGLRTPAAYGGQEADLLTMGIASEEIARGDFSCTYGIQLAGLAGEILGKSGSDEMKERWLPSTARGETIVALALTEPGVGSDAANLSCRAVRDGDAYLITGEKSGISLGMVAQAAILFARTDADAKARGVTAFLVPLDLPGISRSPLRDLGTRAIARAVLSFDHVRVPESHRLGAEGTGGFAGVNMNSLVDVFDRVVEANSHYYLLGYNPPAHPRDGRFHKIEVRVTNCMANEYDGLRKFLDDVRKADQTRLTFERILAEHPGFAALCTLAQAYARLGLYRQMADTADRAIAASLEPGASVSLIAREAGIHPSLLYGWRRQMRVRQGRAERRPASRMWRSLAYGAKSARHRSVRPQPPQGMPPWSTSAGLAAPALPSPQSSSPETAFRGRRCALG